MFLALCTYYVQTKPAFYCFNHNYVRWQPIYTFKSFHIKPLCCLMLFQRQTATFYMTPETVHRQMKLWIVPLDSLH